MDDFAQGIHCGWKEDIWSENSRVGVMEEDLLPFSILAVGKKDLMLLNCHRGIPIINCYVCEVIYHDHLHFTVVVHVETPGLPQVRVLLF